MFDPVFGDIPFVKRQSDFPANPDIFTDIDYLLISHDHFDHLDKQSVARLVKNNPGMKLFCGLGTGELIKGWFPEFEVTEAGWYQQIEDDGLKITFLPALHRERNVCSRTTLEQTFRSRWRAQAVGGIYGTGRWYFPLLQR